MLSRRRKRWLKGPSASSSLADRKGLERIAAYVRAAYLGTKERSVSV